MNAGLDVVDSLSVAENIYLGENRRAAASPSAAPPPRPLPAGSLRRLGHGDVSPHREVGSPPAAGKQIVSMAQALSHDARVIVDEPSAVLDSEEVLANLFHVVREVPPRRASPSILHLAPAQGDPADR